MPDPFKQIMPGDGLPTNAPLWNAMIGAAKDFNARKTDISSSSFARFRQSVIVRVKNETEENLTRGSVLGLDGPVFAPMDSEDSFMREVTFRGGIPDTDAHKKKFVILLDPAKAGAFARAYISGVCQARVDIIDPSHEYANISDGEHEALVSSRYGWVQILWKESDEGGYYDHPYGYDTGEQWAIVRIAAHCPGFALGRAKGNIAPRSGSAYGTGEVDLYRAMVGLEDGPLETIQVLNASQDLMDGTAGISDGAYVGVAWDSDGTAWVSPLECGSEAYY